MLHLPPLKEKEWSGESESDWERNVPLWLDPHCSNRNQVLDSGVNVFPCIFLASVAWTDSDLTALHALSFNETMATYACHSCFMFSKPLYTNFDPWKLSLLHCFHSIWRDFRLIFTSLSISWKELCNKLVQREDLDKHNGQVMWKSEVFHIYSTSLIIYLGMNDAVQKLLHQRKKLWRYGGRSFKKTKLAATLMD